MSFILALDQGTTSSRAIVFNHAGSIRAQAQQELTQHYPQPGWMEQDPNLVTGYALMALSHCKPKK